MNLTQICSASNNFTQTYPDAPNLTQICSDSLSSHSLIQIHLISFKNVPIQSDALEFTQIHTASLQILSASLRLIQIN